MSVIVPPHVLLVTGTGVVVVLNPFGVETVVVAVFDSFVISCVLMVV